MPVRRHANPQSVQHVWNSVRSTQLQKQDNNLSKIAPYLQKVFQCTAQTAETYIQQVVKDNLLVNNQKTGTKVSKGNENYRIPTTENNTPVDDGYDWYCIECHQAGDVTCCQTCHRVFHLECAKKPVNNRVNIIEHSPSSLKNRTLDINKSNSLLSTIDTSHSKTNDDDATILIDDDVQTFCSICRMLRNEKAGLIERDELNYLLNFTLNRIRIWLPANITDVMAPNVANPWMTEQEVAWRVRQLLYQTMDVPLMEMKLRTKEYTKLAEFHADVITIQHNVAIFHGVESQEFQGSELMITDSKYDLVELQQCVDCYRHSNEKRNDMWFCIPCRPPHEIVWAKQKGYPYWPAKIIRNTPNGQYDVRFFGAKHLRAIIEKSAHLKPIETNPQKLQVKRTIPFNKALQELTEHQRLLKNPEDVEKIMSQKPESKQKSPGNKNKQNKIKKAKEPPVNLDEDVYEFSDSLLKVMDPEPPITPEKKKRGRKIGQKNKKLKPIKTSTPKDAALTTVKLSPDRQESVDSNLVSSSTENINSYGRPNLSIESNSNLSFRSRSASGSGSSGTQQLERVYSDPVENLRRQLENMSSKDDKDLVIRTVLEAMQLELDRMQSSHSEHLRSMVDAQNVLISEIKKKQWCFNCEQEAIYHCCWNTAYCSTTCQQQHWQSEHKKTCRRKR